MNLDKIKEMIKRPLVAAALGFLLGLIIGLPVLGWGLLPVSYYDAAPQHLRADLQSDYMRMAIDSFIKSPDATLAKRRYDDLGADKAKVLDAVKSNPGRITAGELQLFQLAVQGGTVQPTALPGQPTKPAVTPTPVAGDSSGTLLIVLCLVLLVIGGALAYLLLFRKGAGGGMPLPFLNAQKANKEAQRTDFAIQGNEPPVAQYMTTYTIGMDLYDDTFSVDSPIGEVLGECGAGITDTIGVGDPKKVTAMEVWLFDKNDIQTVTKVLMSEHAFNDPAMVTKLSSKGEPVLVEPGKVLLLETKTLQLQARVVDVAYGQGALPNHSFFERLTVELAVWKKVV